MNEKSTIKELIAQLRSSEHWVKEIVAAYLGVEPDRVVISVKPSLPNISPNFTPSSPGTHPAEAGFCYTVNAGG